VVFPGHDCVPRGHLSPSGNTELLASSGWKAYSLTLQCTGNHSQERFAQPNRTELRSSGWIRQANRKHSADIAARSTPARQQAVLDRPHRVESSKDLNHT
jgi:hypothetical protein